MRCYIIGVRAGDEDDLSFAFYARISKDGKLARPSGNRGPSVYASRDDALKAVEKMKRYRQGQAEFHKWEDFSEFNFIPVPVIVPIKTATFRFSVELPIKGQT